ncbi:hypothetical protein [Prosthecobacter sp.]|uniref:hypothetical protein n=1 Tax=Prosthecobacter sp. TaxID=1965333 RepID=UPI0037850DF8
MNKVQQTVFIIWGVLCASICGYAAMLSSMAFAPGPAASPSGSFGGILAIIAASSTILSLLLRPLLLGGFSAGTLSLDNPQGRGRFVAGNFVLFALSEGIGVLGFVNGISSTGRGEAWLPYIGLALLMMLYHIPLPSRFRPAA